MLAALFHSWERRLAAVTTDRVTRPFEWGLEWLPSNGCVGSDPEGAIAHWVNEALADSDRFFTPSPTNAYELREAREHGERVWRLTFKSAFTTPHPANNA
ncbi:MAG: hypothetical protein HY654_10160, partial [Acidobacteria bacterium]|nr:hypothetical protein [Acidobacteriota bacterium]